MNILVSDKWLREYVKMKQTPEQFAAAISLVGPSVERIHDQGERLDGVVVGKILAVEKHPNADKLRLVTTDIGNKKLNIVCGGSNLNVGQLVAVATVGARVRWHGAGELVVLEPATIRGVASEGMICGANELGLADLFPHEEKEIMELAKLGISGKPGEPLAKVLGMNDKVYDIEVTTNRPDALGMIGLAREAAAATGGIFLWKDPVLLKLKVNSSKLKVNIQSKKTCSRYQGALIEGVAVGSSPQWMQDRLLSAGLRPINAVVDITNYVMLELGQPMHAFDADKVPGHKIDVRLAKAGEKMTALDNIVYELKSDNMVIAGTSGPLAIAGAIGGKESGVTERTNSIILEAASFDNVSVRKTGRALNVRTDAIMRFEKQVPQGLIAPAMARAVQLVLQICGGTLVASSDVVAKRELMPRLSVSVKELSDKIGVEISPVEAKKHLTALGFIVTGSIGKLLVKVPYWRVGDIGIAEDLVEEVARLHGYHKLPSVMPPGVSGEAPDPLFAIEDKLRDELIGAGAVDLMSTSLTGDELLKKSGEGELPVMRIANPLAADLNCLQPSHRARLLEAVAVNEKNFSSGSAFEIGKVFTPAVDDDELPIETLSLGLVVWDREKINDRGETFYQAKGLLERAAHTLHAPLTFGKDVPNNDFWHPGRSVSLHIGTAVIGILGELTPAARVRAGIESRIAFASLDMAELVKVSKPSADYRAPSAYPPILRDIAFIVPRKTEHEFIVAAIKDIDPLITNVEIFDHYEGKGIENGKKNLAYHLTYQSNDRTLVASEIDSVHAKVARMLEHKFHATIRE